MNRVLEDMLRHYVNPRQDDWDTLLPILEFLKNAPDALNEYWDTVAVRAAAKSKKRGPDGYMAPVSKKLKGK